MPVAIRRDPFIKNRTTDSAGIILRAPQARVLAPLIPAYPEDHVSEWPLINRAQLGVRAGYTAISGTVTRALNGIRPGSSSGDAHPGLLALKLVEEVMVDIEGRQEVNYRATAEGIRVYKAYLASLGGELPKVRDKEACTNDRYKKV